MPDGWDELMKSPPGLELQLPIVCQLAPAEAENLKN
jgi:hypothetical protein